MPIYRSNDSDDRNSFSGDLQNRSEAFATSGGLSGFSDLKNDLFRKRGGGGGTPVGDAYERLTRQMWDTYVTNFMPYENKLIDYATSATVATDAMATASDFIDQSFDTQQASSQRRLKGLGLKLSADEQAASDKSFGLAKSLADVGAQNMVRDQTVARQRAILGNPVPTLPQI